MIFKKGDKVALNGREEVTGEIIDIRTTYLWQMTFEEYLVKYDNDNLIPTQDWHEGAHLVKVDNLPVGEVNKVECECGAYKVMGENAKHSDFCPLYRKY